MNRHAYLLLLCATLFWGANNIAARYGVGHVSPGLLTALRWALSLILLIPFSLAALRNDWPVIRRKWPVLLAFGAIGFAGFNMLIYTAAAFTSIVNMSIEQAAMPIFIFVINFVIFRVGIAWLQLLGVIASLLGVAIVATHGDLSRLTTLDLNIGDAYNLAACLIYAIYSVFLRYRPKLHWKSWMVTLGFAALLASLPYVGWEITTKRLIWPDQQGWLVVIFTGIFPSLISQTLYLKGNALIGANRAGIFLNMVPVFGTILAVLLLGEAFHGYQALAFVLIMGGIAAAEWSARKSGMEN